MVLEFPQAPDGIIDTTSRKICTTFEQYIYYYEVMAQLTRLAYCDSGIAKKVFDTDFGKDNYTVMQAIAKYDAEYSKERRLPLNAQINASIQTGSYIPHESYALGPSPDTTKHRYGTYIATSEVLTAYIIDTSVANGIMLQNGPFKDTDVIISFKGTNTFKEAIHDFKSAFLRTDLSTVVQSLGFTPLKEDSNSFINGSFSRVLLHAWDVLIKGVTQHSGTGPFRLFCNGHSLGGAYCTLFGFILGYLKGLPGPAPNNATSALLKRIESIHVISLGSPTLCADKARNTFNRSLISGLMTFDRLVTQKVGSLTAQPYFVDIIPLIPAGFSHPGFKQSALSFKQDKNRPYKLSSIYHLYEKGEPKIYRLSNPTPMEIQLMEEAKKAEKEGEQLAAASASAEENPRGGRRRTQRGGLFGFGQYKSEYEQIARKMASNFISVPTPPISQGVGGTAVPHLVYFGMRYVTGLRFPGMKNPVPPHRAACAYFGLYEGPGGVLIHYTRADGSEFGQKISPLTLPVNAALLAKGVDTNEGNTMNQENATNQENVVAPSPSTGEEEEEEEEPEIQEPGEEPQPKLKPIPSGAPVVPIGLGLGGKRRKTRRRAARRCRSRTKRAEK